jgi:hypothetical protein
MSIPTGVSWPFFGIANDALGSQPPGLDLRSVTLVVGAPWQRGTASVRHATDDRVVPAVASIAATE